jgi:ribonuclease VapC
LEYVYGHEPAYTLFQERLEAAQHLATRLFISRINYGEIVYNFQGKRNRGEIPADIDLNIESLPWKIITVDDALIDEAVELKSVYPVSYADCFAAALARRYNAPVMTGDPDFLKLQAAGVVSVDWLGK